MGYFGRYHDLLPIAVMLALGIALLHFNAHLIPDGIVYGRYFLPSAGALMVSASAVFFGVVWLKRTGEGIFTLTIFCIAALVSLHYLHITDNELYTNDVAGHWERFRYILAHWRDPFSYNGWQKHHPPLYYYIVALANWLTGMVAPISDLTVARFISWLAYLIFNAYGLRTLRKADLSMPAYYTSAALLLLWPGGFHLATKISPEPLYYACYAVAFYYTIIWYQRGDQLNLIRAFVMASLAILVRTSAIILFAVISTLAIAAFIRGRFRIEKKHLKQWILCGLFLIACAIINSTGIYMSQVSPKDHFGIIRFFHSQEPSISHYVSINFSYFIENPFVTWNINQTLPDYLLKTSLFGEYTWPWPFLGNALNIILVGIVIYLILPWFISTRAQRTGILPYVIGLVVPLTAHIIFIMVTWNIPSQDVRYIYPSLVCFIVFFGKSQGMYKERGALLLSYLGSVMVAVFALTAIIFFWTANQHLRCPTVSECGDFTPIQWSLW